MKSLIPLFLLTLTPLSFIWSQTVTDLNEGAQLTHDSANDTWSFSWWGHSGRTYFIQQSEELIDWQYIPVIEPGQDAVIEWGFNTNADKLFMRLKHTDMATSDPWNDDFDGDGIANMDELTAPAQLNLDPLDPDSNDNGVPDGLEDTDGDGMLNGEEIANGLDPLANDAMLDLDDDGYPNIYELRGANGNPNDDSIVPTPTYTVATDGSGDYSIIEDAIDSATTDYSIILVKAGTYTGANNPDFDITSFDPKILLISESGADETILDGEGVRRGGQISKESSALVGFTIRNCYSASGGGLRVSAKEALVADCKIYNNRSSNDGGGLYLNASSTLSTIILVKNCEIYDNTCREEGGGIFMGSSGFGVIQNTLIYRNYAKIKGGGIYCNWPKGDKIEHTTLYNNQSPSGSELARTGGVSEDLMLTNCILWNETTTDMLYGTDITATYSIIRDTSGYVANATVSNDDPELTSRGLLTIDSDEAIDKGTDTEIVADIHGESRPNGTASDIGADEFVDDDSDGLPNWLEALGATDPSGDEDGDNLSNLDDYKAGTDTFNSDTDGDDLEDGEEVNLYVTDPLSADTDEDGICDGEEVSYNLDPLSEDAMFDLDGDGYPNIYELRNLGGNPNDKSAVPTPTYTVATDGSGDYSTLQDSIDAATADYSIILVKAGTYTGVDDPTFVINSDDPSILLISEDGADKTIVDGEGVSKGAEIFKDESAIVGFTIRNCNASVGSALRAYLDKVLIANCKIYNNVSTSYGGGLYLKDRTVSRSILLVKNCEIYDNKCEKQGGGIFMDSSGVGRIQNTLIYGNYAKIRGGGIHWNVPKGDRIEHTTVYNNESPSGSELARTGGSTADLILTNSIVWNDTETDVLNGSNITAGYSIIKETTGYTTSETVSNENPNLDFRFLLTAASVNAINQGTDSGVLRDIQGELRPFGGGSDIGADEFVDSDTDQLPDWWENFYGLNPNSAGDASLDTDNDGSTHSFTNLEEYSYGTDPTNPDSDGDHITDGQEIQLTGTNPLVPDSSELDTDFNMDGLDDSIGAAMGYSPADMDVDGDGLSNAEELELGTSPFIADTDGDGVNDSLDAFPNDPDVSSIGGSNPADVTIPAIVLRKPPEAIIL